MPMRVLLVYKGRYHVRQALDLETLAAVLRAAGHEVSLEYDPDTFGVTDNVLQIGRLSRRLSRPDRAAARIAAAAPDVALFSALPATFRWCLEVARRLKELRDTPTVFLGLHPSLAPERVVREPCVDYVVQGEAEDAVPALLAALPTGNLHDVGNLWRMRQDTPLFNRNAELVDLDRLPLPDKDLFRPFVSHTYSYAAIVSRGCPFACSFCEETCSRKQYGAAYFRRKSVNTVMRELREGKRRYRFREVIFKDSYLSGDIQWLEELISRFREEIRVPFKCFCTISGFDRQTAVLLKEGGCYSVEFGLQTWNDTIRRRVLGRVESSEDARRVFDICAEHGLWYDVDHMFGLPGETESDHRHGAEQYALLKHLNRIKVHHLVYLPGAEMIRHAIEAGHVPADFRERLCDGLETDFYGSAGGEDALVRGYAVLYKLLPGLPDRVAHVLLRERNRAFLSRIPKPVLALLQAFLALRSRDLRFAAYLRYYPLKVIRALLGVRRR